MIFIKVLQMKTEKSMNNKKTLLLKLRYHANKRDISWNSINLQQNMVL